MPAKKMASLSPKPPNGENLQKICCALVRICHLGPLFLAAIVEGRTYQKSARVWVYCMICVWSWLLRILTRSVGGEDDEGGGSSSNFDDGWKFWKVCSILNLLRAITVELTLENYYLRCTRRWQQQTRRETEKWSERERKTKEKRGEKIHICM